jgi:hypothetical protein
MRAQPLCEDVDFVHLSIVPGFRFDSCFRKSFRRRCVVAFEPRSVTPGRALGSNTPHDALFRAVFSRREEAAGALRSVLPEAFVARIDWATLQLVNGCFIDEALGRSESDLLYTARIEREEAFIYVLFEHQSSIDPLMAFRMLRYMMRIWESWLAEHRGARRLPPIVPVVLAHAESRWSAPTSMIELYDISAPALDAIAQHLPSFSFVLDDLRVVEDEELKARPMRVLGRIALLLLRHGRDARGLIRRLRSWVWMIRDLREEPGGAEVEQLLLRYIALANEGVKLHDLRRALDREVGSNVEENGMVTLEELMMEQSEERRAAMADALLKAMCEAIVNATVQLDDQARGRAQALLTVIKTRGLEITNEQRIRIDQCFDLATLDRWVARSVTAQTVADIISDT